MKSRIAYRYLTCARGSVLNCRKALVLSSGFIPGLKPNDLIVASVYSGSNVKDCDTGSPDGCPMLSKFEINTI